MRVGIIIPIYNRQNLVKKCFDSLKKTFLPKDCTIYLIDDCSTEKEIKPLIENFKLDCNLIKIYNKENKGINYNLLKLYDELFNNGFEYVIVLDSDSVVNNYFYDLMTYFHSVFPENIISGFNTLNLSEFGTQRHPIIENHGWYVKKNTSGALCFGIGKKVYEKYTRPVLEEFVRINKRHPFDTKFTREASKEKPSVICTVPSIAEHTGIEVSTLGHNYNPDVSCDFKPYIELGRKKPITFNFATYPLRREWLEKTIKKLLTINIVDKIRVYLNEYIEVPQFLINERIEYVIGLENIKDTGKFYWMEQTEDEYYFTADDDLEYTEQYILKHIELCDKHKGDAVISLHGKVLNEKPSGFTDVKKDYHFARYLDKDEQINLPGTGVMLTDTSKIKIPLSYFKYHGMTDIYVGLFCQQNKIKCFCRKHSENELSLIYKGKDTLWNKQLQLKPQQDEVLQTIDKWVLIGEEKKEIINNKLNIEEKIIMKIVLTKSHYKNIKLGEVGQILNEEESGARELIRKGVAKEFTEVLEKEFAKIEAKELEEKQKVISNFVEQKEFKKETIETKEFKPIFDTKSEEVFEKRKKRMEEAGFIYDLKTDSFLKNNDFVCTSDELVNMASLKYGKLLKK